MTRQIVERAGSAAGWEIFGKTGSAYPRRADGSFDRARGSGRYVGWATKGNRELVFATLVQDQTRHAASVGLRARDALVKAWPVLAGGL